MAIHLIGPFVFALFTLVHAGIAFGALLAAGSMPVAAVCLFIVEAVTVFDNAVTVAGNRMGIAPRTEGLNRRRYMLQASCIGLLIPVYAGIAAQMALPAGSSWIYGLSLLMALLLGIYGYFFQFRGTHTIMPVCYYGCLRYAQSVSKLTRHPDYRYSPQQLAARGRLPVVSIVTTFVGLIIAALIGWFASLWVPFIVTALMLLAGGLPLRSWGPLATSGLEIVFSCGMLYSLLLAAGSIA